MGKDRIDPFELFLDYIEGKSSAPEPDTFDFLGAQLGL